VGLDQQLGTEGRGDQKEHGVGGVWEEYLLLQECWRKGKWKEDAGSLHPNLSYPNFQQDFVLPVKYSCELEILQNRTAEAICFLMRFVLKMKNLFLTWLTKSSMFESKSDWRIPGSMGFLDGWVSLGFKVVCLVVTTSFWVVFFFGGGVVVVVVVVVVVDGTVDFAVVVLGEVVLMVGGRDGGGIGSATGFVVVLTRNVAVVGIGVGRKVVVVVTGGRVVVVGLWLVGINGVCVVFSETVFLFSSIPPQVTNPPPGNGVVTPGSGYLKVWIS